MGNEYCQVLVLITEGIFHQKKEWSNLRVSAVMLALFKTVLKTNNFCLAPVICNKCWYVCVVWYQILCKTTDIPPSVTILYMLCHVYHYHITQRRNTYQILLKVGACTWCLIILVIIEQAGTELGQAQLKLGLDFTLIFRRFGFSRLDW